MGRRASPYTLYARHFLIRSAGLDHVLFEMRRNAECAVAVIRKETVRIHEFGQPGPVVERKDRNPVTDVPRRRRGRVGVSNDRAPGCSDAGSGSLSIVARVSGRHLCWIHVGMTLSAPTSHAGPYCELDPS